MSERATRGVFTVNTCKHFGAFELLYCMCTAVQALHHVNPAGGDCAAQFALLQVLDAAAMPVLQTLWAFAATFLNCPASTVEAPLQTTHEHTESSCAIVQAGYCELLLASWVLH
jgi:hypothetical protein